MKTHVAAKHTGKQFACDEPGCDKKFTRRSFFLIHKRDHEGVRNYPCEHCSKKYKHKSHLTRHVEATHLNVRHECEFPGCNAIFTTSWSLKMHKFAHSTEKSQLPYQCDVCKCGFQRRDKWLKHLKKSHPNHKFDVPVSLEIPTPQLDTTVEIENTIQNESTNYIVLSTNPNEIYTIQNDMVYEFVK